MDKAAAAPEVLLRLREVGYKHRRKAVLQGANLTISRGEVVALIGDNGVGKTTLLSIAANLLKPQSGLRDYANPMPRIAWVGDKAALYPDWTVEMFLYCRAELQGVSNPKAVAQAAVAACGLETVLQMPCAQLSHGFRQRVALASALASEPDLLCLDEPSNGLDRAQTVALREILAYVAQRAGVLLIHHDLAEALLLADRIYALHQGKCFELSVPPKAELWLWCEWDLPEQAAQLTDAQQVLGNCSGYRFDSVAERVEKMQALSAAVGLQRMGFAYPAAALQAQREAL